MKISNASLVALASAGVALAASGAGIAATPAHQVYEAHLQPLNTQVAKGDTRGTAKLTINGDKLTIAVEVHGAPPDTIHWQHFHGFPNGQPASCATMADAGADGILDLTETEQASGTTMVPFDTHPAKMDVAHGTYPKANAHGDYRYSETVSLKALDAAFAKQFPGQKLDLANRVVYIHGVPSDTKLPDTVKSLGPIPAQVTIPIACGKLEAVK